MAAFVKKSPAAALITAFWAAVFLLSFISGLEELLPGKGINHISGEYYRYFTQLLFHVNLIHLLFNSVVLYWLSVCIERITGSLFFIVFGFLCGGISQFIFALFFTEHLTSFGGSPLCFALLGLTAAMQITMKSKLIKPRTRCGKWLICALIIGFLPISGVPPYINFQDYSPVILHLLALFTGAFTGYILIKLKILKQPMV